ncbi:MAG TPA: nucleotide disphospho-sugar-binding domain-containing protein [Dermatophilaceae bacterium]|nr:nucleotide disphospho-sugar-binding domain-containing protein [Dermatophilaceae bacterium]
MPWRYLLALIDAGGTVPPALGLAAELVRRGHDVHVLSDPTVEASAGAAGCTFSSWREAPHVNTREEQTALIAAIEGRNPYRAFRAAKEYAGKDMTSRFARDLVNTVRDVPVDAILSDGLPGMLIGGQATGLPTAVLLANVYARPTVGLPLLGTGWSPGPGRVATARDSLAPRIATWLLARTLPRLNAVAAEYGQPRLGDVFELFDRCRRVLVMTSPSFDFSAPHLPANVRYVGPQLDDPDWAAEAEWSQQSSQPLVLVALSSVYQGQSEVLRRISHALGRLDVSAVLTTGRAVDPSQIDAPSNVQVLRAAPHRQVLAKASVVVTHAGHGIVMKALAAGVPMVCMPMGRDQKDNTARVLRLRAGVQIGMRSDSDRIAAAVSDVMSHAHYAAAARQFAAVLAREASTRPRGPDEAEALLADPSDEHIQPG